MMNYVPQSEEAPNTDIVIAVQSLTPSFGLMCLQPVDGYPAGYIHKVVGANLTRPSYYIYPGTMPSVFRSALEAEDYPDEEVLFEPLPDLMAEIDPADYPKCFQLVILNGEVIPKPTYAEYRPAECKVIQHPAVYFNRVTPRSKPPKIDPAQQRFPFATDPNVQPQTQIA